MSWIEKNCELCEVNFYIPLNRALNNRGKFCSEKCLFKARAKFPRYIAIQKKATKINSVNKVSMKTRLKIRKSLSKFKDTLVGKRYTKWGEYVYIYDHKHYSHVSDNYCLEHRYIVEKILNKPLKSSEPVHHINGIKNDNRIENLMAFKSDSAHFRFHWGNRISKKEIIFDGRDYVCQPQNQ